MSANPLLIDPTRTVMLRRRFAAEVKRRFAALAQELRRLIVGEDAFGIQYRQHLASRYLSEGFNYVLTNDVTTNSRWAYLSTPEQLEQFRLWLDNQIALTILQRASPAPWIAKFMREAYLKGQVRAFTEIEKPALWTGTSPQTSAMGIYRGLEAQFMQGPVSPNQLTLLTARANAELKGATDAMSQQLSREILDGMVRNLEPSEVADRVSDRIEKVGLARSLAMVEAEVIRAHSEAVLDAMEALGETEVGVMVEWRTGSNPCVSCQALSRVVMTIEKARGKFPRHPRCRCSPVPVGNRRDNKEQLRTKREVMAAIHRSVRAEYPKRSLSKAKASSRWYQSND